MSELVIKLDITVVKWVKISGMRGGGNVSLKVSR